MRHFIPTNSFPSPGAAIEALGGVKHRKSVGWEAQRRVPPLVAASIAQEKARRHALGYPV